MVRWGSSLGGLVPFLVMGSLFVVVDVLALLLVGPFSGAGLYAFEDSGDPVDVVYFAAMMVVTTGVILALRRFRKGVLVRWVMLGAIWFSLFSTLYTLSWFMLGDFLAVGVSALLSLGLVYLLVRWRRWYIIDTAAVLLGAVTTTVLGISLSPPLTAALLLLLTVYDAIAVYKTKHMLTLAETILDSGLPLVLIVPRGGYVEGGNVDIVKGSSQGERRAYYMGLGDLIIPGCLVVSIYSTMGSVGLPIIVAVLLGTLVGFAVLSVLVARGKPQAGLPFLCGGAVMGYVVSSYLLFEGLVVLL